MTTLREAAQMALDALDSDNPDIQLRAATHLRAALAQPEQEPLPAKSKGSLSHEENKQHNKKILGKFYEENAHLYTAPPQRDETPAKAVEWQGLTDEEMRSFWDEHVVPMFGRKHMNPIVFGRIIEAKLREKNAT